MLTSIILENWKTHFKSTINFAKGTNIFVGRIGAGKSSIVDAICYALYGTYPALQAKKLTLSETIMFKPSKKEHARVTLFFDYEGNYYRVEREIYLEKINTAKLYSNNKLIAGPKQTDVNNALTSILGIDYNLFVKIVYSEQNEMDYFLKIPPGKRKEQFDSLFGISNLDSIKSNAKELSKLVGFDKEKFLSLHLQITNQLHSFDIQETEKEYKATTESIASLELQISKLASVAKALEIQYSRELDRKKQFEKLNTEKSILSSRLLEVTTKLSERGPISGKDKQELLSQRHELELKIKDTEQDNKKIELEYSALLTKLSFYKEQLQALDKEIAGIKSKVVSIDKCKLTKELEIAQSNFDTLTLSILESSSILTTLSNSISELEKGFSRCPVCDSLLSQQQIEATLKDKLALHTKAMEHLETQKARQEVLLKELETLRERQRIAQENELLEKKVLELSKQQECISKAIKDIEDKLSLLPEKQDTKQFSDLLSAIDSEIDCLALLDKKAELEASISNITSSLNNLSYSEEQYLSIATDYKGISERTATLNSQILMFKKQENGLATLIDRHKNLEKDAQAIQAQLDKTERLLIDLSSFITAIENSQNQLRKLLVDNINKALSLIWPKVYPYGDYLSARLKAEDDYILEVQAKDNAWIRVEGLLSGGERTCAALSIRVAIALTLTKKLGLLILDEPTHNLDTKAVSLLLSVLEKDLPELVEQVFIVTHDQKLLETGNASKYVIERDKENDGVSEITEE